MGTHMLHQELLIQSHIPIAQEDQVLQKKIKKIKKINNTAYNRMTELGQDDN